MPRKNVKLLMTTLILLELSIMTIAALPPTATTAKAALQTDMPVVFVDPVNATADIGETFTISAKVFNLSGLFWSTEASKWSEGQPLPPYSAVGRTNMSLGHLYSIDLRLKWDPTILEYVSRTVMVPVEGHVGGILHEAIVAVADTVDPVAGTYTLAQSSQSPAPAFNAPNANATAFTMTFRVKRYGKCAINFTNVDLAVDLVGLGFPPGMWPEVPHWTVNGVFQAGELKTRIESIQGGALIEGSLKYPVIQGEDMSVQTVMKNDNETTTDTFNLTIYDGTTLLNTWSNQVLSPDSTSTLNYTTVDAPSLGVHTITAEASVLHDGEVETDTLRKNVTVVATPTLVINGPSTAVTGTTVSFSAGSSVGSITQYKWTLWKSGESLPFSTQTGEEVSFVLPSETERTGDWTIMLVVTDNFGITAQQQTGATLLPTSELLRPATAPYRTLWTLNVQLSGGPGLNIEWILLAIILIVIIAVAILYLRRRSR